MPAVRLGNRSMITVTNILPSKRYQYCLCTCHSCSSVVPVAHVVPVVLVVHVVRVLLVVPVVLVVLVLLLVYLRLFLR